MASFSSCKFSTCLIEQPPVLLLGGSSALCSFYRSDSFESFRASRVAPEPMWSGDELMLDTWLSVGF